MSRTRPYANRREAAQQLSENLLGYDAAYPVVLGIPRGGVVIADVVGAMLDTEMDIVLTRKLGAPGNPELAIGAVAENGAVLIQDRIAEKVGASEEYIRQEKARQLAEIDARRQRYRAVLPKVPLEGRSVILVDDGIATGATMQAAIWVACEEGAERIVVAVPVASPDAIERLRGEADDVICPYTPEEFYAIGQFFEDFGQIGDEEVLEILRMHSLKMGQKERGRMMLSDKSGSPGVRKAGY